MKKTYSEKLKDPRWQKRRLEVMERADFHCQGCFDNSKTLHIHHALYRKGAEPWEYEDHELICFCEDCHLVEEETRSAAMSSFAKFGLFADWGMLKMAFDTLNSAEQGMHIANAFSAWAVCARCPDILAEADRRIHDEFLMLKWQAEMGVLSQEFVDEYIKNHPREEAPPDA